MLGRLRRVVAKTLAQEHALRLSLIVSAVGLIGFTLAYVVAAIQVGAPDDPYGMESVFLGLVVTLMFLAIPLGVVALRGAWVGQRVVDETIRDERRMRALKADPGSAYGLPAFPEMEAGNGQLTPADSGSLTEAASNKDK